MSKRPGYPYQTIADSAATRCQHHGDWAMSERYLLPGDSETTPAEKPVVINPRSWTTMVRPGRVPDWLVSLVRAIPVQNNGPIQFGPAAYHRKLDHVRSKKYAATEGFWPGHGRRNPGPSGEAALIQIPPQFPLDQKRAIDND